MKRLIKQKRIWLVLLFPVTLLLVLAARLNNAWVEHLFYPYVYRPLATVIGTAVSLVPFSVTEVLIVILTILLVYFIAINTISIVKRQQSARAVLARLSINAVCIASVVLFLFEICMGLNYYRYEAKYYLGLELRERSKEDLYELCRILVNDMNENRAELETDENGVAKLLDDSHAQTSISAREAYRKLSEKYPFLKSVNIRNKPLVSSKLFSRMFTTGVYMPFTFESNINVDVPEFTIPATMCHELTHFRGFMRENEANFIGYLACMESGRADFRYSASLMAFEYCFSKLHREDKQLAGEIADMCDEGIITDLSAEDEYWEKYEHTAISRVSSQVYNGYLNANGQQSGLKSYGEMVDLLIAYYIE